MKDLQPIRITIEDRIKYLKKRKNLMMNNDYPSSYIFQIKYDDELNTLNIQIAELELILNQ